MLHVVVSGLVTGWAIAVPIGAVGAFLVTLSARSRWQVGVAAALGIATVDGGYALLATVAGSALSAALAPVAGPLRVVAAVVLLVVAAVTAAHAWTPAGGVRQPRVIGPRRAFALFVGITAVNPTTVVYFAAVVLGDRDLTDDPAQSAVFVLAAFAASASWQLVLAGLGRGLGALTAGPRGRRVTGLVSAAVIAGLAVRTLVS